MNPLVPTVERLLAERVNALAVVLPGGRRIGAAGAAVELAFDDWADLAPLVAGRIGRIAEAYVEGRVRIAGTMRQVMTCAVQLLAADPVAEAATQAPGWWRSLWQRSRSQTLHTPEADARQVEFHYDLGDDFYALWLDARRVYSCAYWREGVVTLDAAQEAKLDLICRKLQLAPGQRLLDVGAGWGALLLWAAEHYGVEATGITLSRHQHAHVTALIERRGLAGRVRMLLADYRELHDGERYDRIASVGMFEHVGRANLAAYFEQLHRLLAPGGLLLNHGITAGGTRHRQLGAGIGDFVERFIFPGGELVHLAHEIAAMADAGWEVLDAENLRPHYALTLWAWSDALEARLDAARAAAGERAVRAYRLYLAGSAMAFEHGWMSLHQVLAARPDGRVEEGRLDEGRLRGAQSAYPFTRDHIYPPCSTSSSPKPPAT